MQNSIAYFVRIYWKFEYLFISFLRNFLINSTVVELSTGNKNSVCWNFTFLKKYQQCIFFQQKCEAEVIMYSGVQVWITSLYISQLKRWEKKNEDSTSIDPYFCKITISRLDKITPVNVGHIPRQISRFRVFYFLQESGSKQDLLISSGLTHTKRWVRDSNIDAFFQR